MSEQAWQKSSYSGAHDECVEVRAVAEGVEFRESDDPGVIVRATHATLLNLLDAIKVGELDHHA
ncbi:DUF397 domain-containing protein [Kitasatospora purpeofusca]|uniref:DUF397 domain-containing protein n=1 Tax=Kitasatospora purpeofusca TaxID=67352 RepID=UPI0038671B8C|nr:DUF397 domain-containing protein [Kitasatospora purpeofusca]